jgi:hypothetical protein
MMKKLYLMIGYIDNLCVKNKNIINTILDIKFYN